MMDLEKKKETLAYMRKFYNKFEGEKLLKTSNPTNAYVKEIKKRLSEWMSYDAAPEESTKNFNEKIIKKRLFFNKKCDTYIVRLLYEFLLIKIEKLTPNPDNSKEVQAELNKLEEKYRRLVKLLKNAKNDSKFYNVSRYMRDTLKIIYRKKTLNMPSNALKKSLVPAEKQTNKQGLSSGGELTIKIMKLLDYRDMFEKPPYRGADLKTYKIMDEGQLSGENISAEFKAASEECTKLLEKLKELHGVLDDENYAKDGSKESSYSKLKNLEENLVTRINALKKYRITIQKKLIKNKLEERKNKFYSKESFKNIIDVLNEAIMLANKDIEIHNKDAKTKVKLMETYTSLFEQQSSGVIEYHQVANAIKGYQMSAAKEFKKRKMNFQKYYNMALNRNGDLWKPYEDTAEIYSSSGKKTAIKCAVVPANSLNIYEHLSGDDKGITSSDRKSEHVANLWSADIKGEDGSEIFKGIRHANTRGRKEATRDVILAVALQQYGKQLYTDGQKFDVKLSNVQLMSPTKLGIGDKNLPSAQIKAFKEVVGKDLEYKLKKDGREIKIKLRLIAPLLFNFGSNSIQYNSFTRNVVETDFKKQNTEGMISLFGEKIIKEKKKKPSYDFGGEVGAYLKNPQSKKESKRKAIKILSKQILDMWFDGSYTKDVSDPYAIQARLVVLSYYLGYPVSFNCKSGKDRTGLMWAEVVRLISEINANGKVPKPHKKLSSREKANLSECYNKSGNGEIQKACTGVLGTKGSKLKALGFDVSKRYGGDVGGNSGDLKVLS